MCALSVLALVNVAVPAHGADVLVYGPSLAPANGGDAVTLGRNGATDAPAGPTVVNEATIATDHGHNVTVVDEATWSGMTPEQFAAYDAIVIGDAGCDFSDGEDLAAVDANKSVWSPVVTGNVAMNTFDAFYHIFQDATVEAGARALAGSGIDFAASGDGTGLYY
ncbi:MAG: hypothetical protein K8H90_09430, partial [Thermoanaerobaculia bacterium]|nr:hypothetical protein [Thermoanaerobaculia bacterium]